MKFQSKIIALLMVLVLSVSVFGAFGVSATEEEDYSYTVADVEAIAELYGMTYEEALTALGITEDDLVDSAAASDSDAVVTYTDMLSAVEFTTKTTDAHGITYKVPVESTIYSPDSSDLEIYNYTGTTKKELLNSYSLVEMSEYTAADSQAVVYYQISAEEDTAYGKYIGSFNDLSKTEKDELVQIKVEEGYDAENTYMVRNGGQVYLVARMDNDYAADSGLCTTEAEITTVINGTYYSAYIYVQHGGTASDAAIVDDLIKSFTIKGELSDAQATNVIAIVALCIVGVLLIVIAFLVFFIIRFSAFSKASGSKFNIIGFSMPKKASETASSKHNFHAKSGVEESLED